MAAKRKTERKSRSGPSGPNISEQDRNTERCTVRLGPGYLARLDALVEGGAWASRGDLIEAWIDCEENENAAGRQHAKPKRVKR